MLAGSEMVMDDRMAGFSQNSAQLSNTNSPFANLDLPENYKIICSHGTALFI